MHVLGIIGDFLRKRIQILGVLASLMVVSGRCGGAAAAPLSPQGPAVLCVAGPVCLRRVAAFHRRDHLHVIALDCGPSLGCN